MGFSDAMATGGSSLPMNNGQFLSTATQTVASATAPQVITFNDSSLTGTMALGGTSRITLGDIGNYLVALSAISNCSSGSNKSIYIWLRLNGTDVPNSNTIIGLTAGQPGIIAATFILPCNTPGDYYEFWMAGETTNMQILATAASAGSPPYPLTPSIIVTANQIS